MSQLALGSPGVGARLDGESEGEGDVKTAIHLWTFGKSLGFWNAEFHLDYASIVLSSRFDELDEHSVIPIAVSAGSPRLMGDRCNKCRVSLRSEGNAWCLGCLSWESLEKDLCATWVGPPGVRVIADNLVLNAAREVRALRALGAGIGRGTGAGAGNLPAAERVQVKVEKAENEKLVGTTASCKSKAKPASDEESYEYTYEEESEAPPKEEIKQSSRVGSGRSSNPLPALQRSSRPSEEVGSWKDETIKREDASDESRRRKKHRGEKEKKRTREETDSRWTGDRQRQSFPEDKKEKGGDKKKRKKRGGKKHKRLHRLEQDPYKPLHRSLDKSFLETRPGLERNPLP